MQENEDVQRLSISSCVYVVYGRNTAERDRMYHFLEALGLQPITKETVVQWTGSLAPYTDQMIDEAFKRAQVIIVLFTGDDFARLRPQLQRKNDPRYEKELTPQPRQDQIFEAGYAFGRSPKRTILLQIGKFIRQFSDIDERYIADFSWKDNDLKNLVIRLKSAECAIKLDKQYWELAGLSPELYREIDLLMKNDIRNDSFKKDFGIGKDKNEINIKSKDNEVFIIHGRNRNISNHLLAFLDIIGLLGIPWQEAVLSASEASSYIGEVLDVMMQRAQAVIVLLTGDDEGCLRKE